MSGTKEPGTPSRPTADGFTEPDRKAMKERAAELRAEGRAGKKRADAEAAVLEKIAEMPQPDRGLAERFHAIVLANAPDLVPKTWYGMPAYARDGKVVCFFQAAAKFEARYSTIGFQDAALIDDGTMWPTAFAVTEQMTAADEQLIASLVRRSVG